MPVGNPITKAQIDQNTGQVAAQLRAAFVTVGNLKAFLDAKTDSDLGGYGYDATDIASLRSAFADADQLRRIYEGTEALASAKNFRTFLQRLWGVPT